MKKAFIQPRTLAITGIISGVVGVYASSIHPAIAAVLVIPVVIWGGETVRRIASYGLGTGVPSIGNLATSMGVLSALVGFKFHPIFGAAFAAIAGLIYGVIISRFKILEIPNFKRYIAELSVSSCLILMCLIAIVAGGYSWSVGNYFAERLLPTVFATGFIIIAYWGTSVAVFYPYNVSLGTGERRERTLRVGIILAGMNIVLAGVAMLGSLSIIAVGTYLDALAVIIIGVVVWGYGMYDVLKVCMREAAVTTWTGIPPKPAK